MTARTAIWDKILIGGLLLLSVGVVLAGTTPFAKVPGKDSGIYLYIGQHILRGQRPYADVWESKPPGIFYIDALGLVLGHGSRWGVWALEFLAILGAVLLGFFLIRSLWGNAPAFAGLFIFLYGISETLQGGNLTEEYSLPFGFLALLLFLLIVQSEDARPYCVLLGLAFSASFILRPNNTGVELSILLVMGLMDIAAGKGGSFLRKALWIAAGAVPVPLIAVIYFGAKGILGDFLQAAFVYNYFYAGTPFSLGDTLSASLEYLGPVAWIAAAAFVLALYKLLRSNSAEPIQERACLLLILVGLPVEFILSGLGGRNFAHYFMNWLPLSSLAAGFVFARIAGPGIERLPWRPNLRWSLIALVLVVILAFGAALDQYRIVLDHALVHPGQTTEKVDVLSVYVRKHTQPGERVLVWGSWTYINFLADRETPSRFLFYPPSAPSELSEQYSREFYDQLTANKPVLIVDAYDGHALSIDPATRQAQLAAGSGESYYPANLDAVYGFIQSNYHLVTTVGGTAVYRLNAAAGS